MAYPVAWRVVVTAVSACTMACSLGMQTVPKNWNPEFAPECSDSAAAPALDLTGGVALGLITAMGAAFESSFDCGFTSGQESCDDNEGTALLIGALAATPFILSAAYGVSKGNECGRAQLRHHAHITAQLQQPRTPMAPIVESPAARPLSPPGATRPVSPECDPLIAAWQAEKDPGAQALLYRDMSENCRSRITRTVNEDDYNRELNRR